MGRFLTYTGRLLAIGAFITGSSLFITGIIKFSESNTPYSVHEIKTFTIWFFSIIVAGNIISLTGKAVIETKETVFSDIPFGYWAEWFGIVLMRIVFIFSVFYITDPTIDMILEKIKG